MFDKLIFHVDVNSAYLSWEAVYRLEHLGAVQDLRTIPSAVGGDAAMRRGIILAKSIPAKKYRIQTGETIAEALVKCPDLVLVPPDFDLYEKASAALMNILRDFTPVVEQYSIDEAFLDMTGTQGFWKDPEEAACSLKDRVYRELGFTVNVGISRNKVLAKMASDFKKPDMVHTLFPEEIALKMWPLPVSDLFFVGRATTRKLGKLGIRTIGELAQTDLQILRDHLKKHGEVIWAFANGIDVSVVEPVQPPNKGYGNSTTIPFDVVDGRTAKMVLLALAETVSARLRNDGVKAEVVAVGIKNFELHYESHQCILPEATDITLEIYLAAARIFDELWDGVPIRHLGIHTGRIQEQDYIRQLQLFDPINFEKLEKLDAAVDSIRKRYGLDALKRAVFVQTPIDHMEGGIGRKYKNN